MPYGSITARNFVLASWLGSSKRSGAPTTLYFALLSAATPETVLGVEGSGNGYARVAKVNDDALWDITDETAVTAVEVQWPMSTGEWYDVEMTQWAVYDASTAGNCWAFGALGGSLDMTVANRVPVAAAGDIVITQGA